MKPIIIALFVVLLSACGHRNEMWTYYDKMPKNLHELQYQLDEDFGADAPRIKQITRKVFGERIDPQQLSFDDKEFFNKAYVYIKHRYVEYWHDYLVDVFNGSLVSGNPYVRICGYDILAFWAGVEFDRKNNGRTYNKAFTPTTNSKSDYVAPISSFELPIDNSAIK